MDQGYFPNVIRIPQLPSRLPAETGRSLPSQPEMEQFRRAVPTPEKPSDYEMFVSETVEITEKQIEVLLNFQGITFFPSPRPLPHGIVSIPVRIVETPVKQSDLETPLKQGRTDQQVSPRESMQGDTARPIQAGDAGYLEGEPDVIATAFRLLGIKSPYAISTDLKQFGYELFLQPPYTFAPGDRIPVGPEYVLGPGDEIKITIWGKIEGTWDIVVDRDGTISLPKIGVLGVTGLTFRELKAALHKEISKYYNGFEMNVTLGRLRSIKVYLVGNARHPGPRW